LNPEIGRLPSLVAMRAFVVVGDTLSVRQAGELLHTDHASISRHISNLEATVGGMLFEKNGRGVVLTDLGKKFHRRLKRAFDMLCEATHEARAARPSVLSISAPPGLAHEVLLPAIPRLAEALNGWKINLFTELSSTAGRTENGVIHAYLRYGALDSLPTDMVQVAITKPELFPVASPAFLAKHPKVSTVEEMLELPFMCSDTTGLWERWARHAGINYAFSMRGVEMPNTHLALQAAALGQGIALGNSILAAKAIRRGDLVEVLDKRIALDDYYLVCTRRDWDSSPIKELLRWVERELLAFMMIETSDEGSGT
jgi:LysR family transcriptional regulator, glycine cleavage system transcriptional activator